jgi:hypothetical protein
MYANPHTHLQVARDLQRELRTQAERQRMARRPRHPAGASLGADERPRLATWRAALRLRTSASA